MKVIKRRLKEIDRDYYTSFTAQDNKRYAIPFNQGTLTARAEEFVDFRGVYLLRLLKFREKIQGVPFSQNCSEVDVICELPFMNNLRTSLYHDFKENFEKGCTRNISLGKVTYNNMFLLNRLEDMVYFKDLEGSRFLTTVEASNNVFDEDDSLFLNGDMYRYSIRGVVF